jgi:hypothetical protein
MELRPFVPHINLNLNFASVPETISEIDQKFKELKLANQKLARNSRAGNVYEDVKIVRTETNSDEVDSAKVEETILFTREVIDSSAATTTLSLFSILGYMLLKLLV